MHVTAKDSLTDRLVDQLRELIIRGELRPNQRLVEAELAKSLEVSRTPVREALAKLVGDRLVTSDRRGWLVREHTLEEIKQIYEVRTALEGYAAALAAARRTGQQLQEMEDALAREVELPATARDERYLVNDSLHNLIVQAAHNDALRGDVFRNKQFHFSHQLGHMYSESDLVTARKQHRAIVDAIASCDAAAAEHAAREHMLTDWQSAQIRLQLAPTTSAGPWFTPVR